MNHEGWEPRLLDHRYVFAAFDGINRFYVPVERADLVDSLAYPISVLDRYEPIDVVAERFRAMQEVEQHRVRLKRENDALRTELATLGQHARQLELENANLAAELSAMRATLAAELSAMRATLSWRVTRPLRALRSAQLRRRRAAASAGARKSFVDARPPRTPAAAGL